MKLSNSMVKQHWALVLEKVESYKKNIYVKCLLKNNDEIG